MNYEPPTWVFCLADSGLVGGSPGAVYYQWQGVGWVCFICWFALYAVPMGEMWRLGIMVLLLAAIVVIYIHRQSVLFAAPVENADASQGIPKPILFPRTPEAVYENYLMQKARADSYGTILGRRIWTDEEIAELKLAARFWQGGKGTKARYCAYLVYEIGMRKYEESNKPPGSSWASS